MKAYWISLEMFDIGTTLEPRNHEVNNIHSETKRMVEVAFEQYRSLYLPFTPSRLNCIFVAPTKELAKEWSELLFCDKDNIEFFLYEVEIPEDTVWKNAQWYNNYCMVRGKRFVKNTFPIIGRSCPMKTHALSVRVKVYALNQ